MMFSVPQFIDVEDKIVGPLTWKQLGWIVAMGAVILIAFSIFDATLSIIIAIPTVLFFAAMAFYRPSGLPMITFIANATLFLFRPKVAVWQRPVADFSTTQSTPSQERKQAVPPETDKTLTRDKLDALARMIDRRQ